MVGGACDVCLDRCVRDRHPAIAVLVAAKVPQAREGQMGGAPPPSIRRREVESFAPGPDSGVLVAVGGCRYGRTSQLHAVAMDGVAPKQHGWLHLAQQVAGVAGGMAREID